ncbi:hypothetical protein ACFSN5_05480 [Streptococcus tangpeifui]|uniref:hypothetical protein n=1 Tax=Streptococcus tangpeifui TaxID=2709400 RepID=UPI0013ED14F4|nr:MULTISPECIES: hypothetical protein [unclassified Streptococcus]
MMILKDKGQEVIHLSARQRDFMTSEALTQELQAISSAAFYSMCFALPIFFEFLYFTRLRILCSYEANISYYD